MLELEDTGMERMCLPTQPGNMLMPNKTTFEKAKVTCKRFRGEMTVVVDQDIQDELVLKATKRDTCNVSQIGKFVRTHAGFF